MRSAAECELEAAEQQRLEIEEAQQSDFDKLLMRLERAEDQVRSNGSL